MVEQVRQFWHDQIPGWFPIASSIVLAAFWLGQQQQRILDRLDQQDKQIQAIQEYLKSSHPKDAYSSPLVMNAPPSTQDAGLPTEFTRK